MSAKASAILLRPSTFSTGFSKVAEALNTVIVCQLPLGLAESALLFHRYALVVILDELVDHGAILAATTGVDRRMDLSYRLPIHVARMGSITIFILVIPFWAVGDIEAPESRSSGSLDGLGPG